MTGFLCVEHIRERFTGQKVWVFGTGNDAEKFYNDFSETIQIQGFFDNYKAGGTFCGLEICAADQCTRSDVRGRLLICTFKYEEEIAGQLAEMGLERGRDFFIADFGSLQDMDSATWDLIRLNRSLWPQRRENTGKRRILIPISYVHDVIFVPHAYIGNYFCDKYDATMDCFIRDGEDVICHTIEQVYQSFGAGNIVHRWLTDAQEKRAAALCGEHWNRISGFEDWKNISVYGIHFGTTIVRNYLRRYVPYPDPHDERLRGYLLECMRTIVFWYDRFEEYEYKKVLLQDAAHWEGFIRDIAVSRNIETYGLDYSFCKRVYLDEPTCGHPHLYYKTFWESLTDQEKEYGLKWAEKNLTERLKGNVRDYRKINDPFAAERTGRVLRQNQKIKVLVCPHIFDEDLYMYGPHVFDNNYYAWLSHLGELSRKTPQYDWYLKPHPHGSERDQIIIHEFLERFPTITMIPAKTSPWQLRDEGIKFALTVQGTIGHEYPLLGIQVINAGYNPHMAYNFDWNPSTKEEYDSLLLNLDKLEKKIDPDEIYQYYCLQYLYYDSSKRIRKWPFRNPDLGLNNPMLAMKGDRRGVGTWKYRLFLDEWNEEVHKEWQALIPKMLEEMDSWREDVFYKTALPEGALDSLP